MNVVVTGADGQLGRCLIGHAPGPVCQHGAPGVGPLPSGWVMHGLDRRQLDIRDAEAVDQAFRRIKPDVVINAAAWTDVDSAEGDVGRAMAVNALGAANVAAAATHCGARLFHISTDYVFDGTAHEPIDETYRATALNVYGASKLAGEVAVQCEAPDAVIVRTSWLYSRHGANFVTAILQRAARYRVLDVVDDQTGCPTWAGDLAGVLAHLVRRGDTPAGLYHYAGQDAKTWYAFACLIIAHAVRYDASWADVRVRPVASKAPQMGVHRPAYSVLSCEKIKAMGVRVYRPAERLQQVVESVLNPSCE